MSVSRSSLAISVSCLVIFLCNCRTFYDYFFSPAGLGIFAIFNSMVTMAVNSLDLEMTSNWRLYRKMYFCGTIPMIMCFTLISFFKHYGLSFLEGDHGLILAILLGGVCILVMTAHTIKLLKKDHQRLLDRRELSSRREEREYRSVGRFRVREDDDDFKCFTSD